MGSSLSGSFQALDHLRALEAESIHILREVVAEFQRPVMLYSIGKDSSVMVRLAQKAFYPGKIPFPLLHIDTTYKFREMIEFRDRFCAEIGARLIVHTNREPSRKAPIRSAWAPRNAAACSKPAPCSTLWRKAVSTRRSAAPAATKRNRAPRSASIPSATPSANGTPRISARAVEPLQQPHR